MDTLIKYCRVVEFTLSEEEVKKEASGLAQTHCAYQDRICSVFDIMIEVRTCCIVHMC